MKKLIKTSLFVGWLILIYCLSGQDGISSSGLSTKLLTIIANYLNNFISIDVALFVKEFSLLFRKLAHFSEYFILFVLTYECFKEYKIKNVLIVAIVFCVVYACFDEFHQLFVDGRSGQIIDVLIDSSGVLTSSVFWHLLFKR